MARTYFTSESVTEGHPDKMCDQISDAILDEMLRQDPMARVACETITNTGFRIIPIRITSLKDRNNYVPTPIEDDMKIEGIINTLKDNGKKLEYAVLDYPVAWKD